MKLKAALKKKGEPFKIPDCGRNDLPAFFKEMGFTKGAEIGVYKGSYTKKLLEAGLKVYGIDPWKAYADYAEKHNRFQERQDFLYEHTKRYLAPFLETSQCILIRETSMEALKLIPDESLDFVYIDGHHGFKFVAEDIYEWSKKVRKGGIISGHDYGFNVKAPNDPYVLHVRFVLDAYTQACQIKPWYVLGSDDRKENEERDQWRSWMWLK